MLIDDDVAVPVIGTLVQGAGGGDGDDLSLRCWYFLPKKRKKGGGGEVGGSPMIDGDDDEFQFSCLMSRR